MRRPFLILGSFVLTLAACAVDRPAYEDGEAEAPGEVRPPQPPVPRILRDVATVNAAGTDYTYPVAPAYRTSADGRVTVNLKRVSRHELAFNLFRPEALGDTPFASSPAGALIIAHEQHETTTVDELFPGASGLVQHVTFCEHREANPQTCGPGGADDCYEQTLVGIFQERGQNTRLRSQRVEIRVGNPKTGAAFIRSITPLGPHVAAKKAIPVNSMFEPMIHVDGKLMVARSGSRFAWTRADGSPGNTDAFNILYALADTPCDVDGWTDNVYPIGYAQHHPHMQKTYGFAMYPFRDSQGNRLSPDPDSIENLQATYPWMDRHGKNLFFTILDTTLHYGNGGRKTRYAKRCVNGGCDKREADDKTRGMSVMGLWTHGKMVMLDGLLNNVDYGVGSTPEEQYEVKLYEGEDGGPVWVRIANGRGTSDDLPGATHNSNFIDSLENVFNYHPHMVPTTPRDVVWLMSRSHVTDEVAFDDYLDPHALIVSHMNAATVLVPGEGTLRHADGFDNGFRHGKGNWIIELQNAATSPLYEVPRSGRLIGPGRIEPVALGGVHGRGLWLGGESRVDYDIPAGLAREDWYGGLFIDLRAGGDRWHRVLELPGGVSLAVRRGGHEVGFLEYRSRNDSYRVLDRVALPADRPLAGWRHLGIVVSGNGRRAALYVDGRHLHDVQSDAGTFSLAAGVLSIGGATSTSDVRPFTGWIDELRVIVGAIEPNEVPCNHAGGTLVGMSSRTAQNAGLWDAAQPYLDRFFAGTAAADHARVACLTDYTRDRPLLGAEPVPDTVRLRGALLFPEGPLAHDAPRPGARDNVFCLSCHINSNQGTGRGAVRPDSLKVSALLAGDRPMVDDPRRQPMMPAAAPGRRHARIFGNIPWNLVVGGDGVRRPASAQQRDSGLVVDEWVFPAQP